MAEVNLALRTKKIVAPAPGFTTRFQSRLAVRRSGQRRRNMAGISILVISAVALVVWLLFPYLVWVVSSPLEVFVIWITTISLVVSSLLAYGKAGSVMLRVASGFIPVYLWVAVFALTGLAGLLWVASIRKFAPNFEGVEK
jgi:predicted neutral ceramidase superfamily lipid hydrolase